MRDKRPICAIATAPGQGAIGVVRVSAPDVDVIAALAEAICQRPLGGASASLVSSTPATAAAQSSPDTRISKRLLHPRIATYGPFWAADGQPIDYGLALWFKAPHSYTGEHVLELQGHGGPVVQQILLRRMMEVGADFDIRLAEPGEFTERAFLNDKLDLVQAEAVADLIEASTEQAARSATRSLQGVFSARIDVLAEQLLHLRMLVEATLDFPEEEIEFLERADAAGQLDAIDATLRELFATARSGARLRQGLNVVLTGAPNVGKSSLLNALAGAEVAIVTPIAGTTRDRVIEQISIEGVPINLIDTAGLRETDDVVEQIGIERTWAEIAKADVVVHLRAVQKPRASQTDGADGADEAASCTGSPADPAAVAGAQGSLQPDPASGVILPATGPAESLVHDALPAAGAEQALEAAIEARVPTSAHRLTVINKIDLLGQGGVLPAEAGDMAGTAHPAAEAPARGEWQGQADAPVCGLDVTRLSPVPSRTAAIVGAEGRTDAAGTSDRLYLSARTGEGVEAFRRKLLDIAGFQPGAEGVFIARERHLQALQEALAHLDNARVHVAHGDQSLDLFAEELRLAHGALGRITGAVSADELLGVIFSRFCIGK